MPGETLVDRMEKKVGGVVLVLAAFWFIVAMPSLNAFGTPGSFFHVSDFTLNLFGKFLAYAILALGLDLIWGYTGILSMGHGVFFGLGAYCMGMYLTLEIGGEGVYQSKLPDFMVWNRVKELPLFWKPFHSFFFTTLAVAVVPGMLAAVFGFLAFRTRVRGVYFAIITQALALSAWLVFNRNEINLGGTNGLTNFKKILGFTLTEASTQRGLYVVTAIALCGAYLLCRWIVKSRAGKILLAIRDAENRVLYSGYTPANYKVFVFTVSAMLAGVAGALYVPQVGIITPGRIGVLPSIEMVIWVAVGGRGSLIGAVIGAVGVNWARSYLTSSYPDYWLYFLGGIFVLVVQFFPDGILGVARDAPRKLEKWVRRTTRPAAGDEAFAPVRSEG